MIEKPYFVILTHPNPGACMPLVDDNGMIFFESEIEAITAALGSDLGWQCGYEVFELGGGVWHG